KPGMSRTGMAALALAAMMVGACNSAPEKPQVSIHTAAEKGDKAAVEANLAAGVDVNTLGRAGATPLHYAAWSNHAEVVALLASRGAALDKIDDKDLTPLHYAAQNDYVAT